MPVRGRLGRRKSLSFHQNQQHRFEALFLRHNLIALPTNHSTALKYQTLPSEADNRSVQTDRRREYFLPVFQVY